MPPLAELQDFENKDPKNVLESIASKAGHKVDSLEFAKFLDENDHLKVFRGKFHCKEDVLYFCGNSLGLPPKKAKDYLDEVYNNWVDLGVKTHFTGLFGAAYCDKPGVPLMEEIVGAKSNEVALLNGLTVNLHFLMNAFYKPTKKKWKILIEEHAFPSDRYAVWSQVEHHGYDKNAVMIAEAENSIFKTKDILDIIKKHGHEIAVVLLPGIQYYTGQLFDMETITKAAQEQGCIVGWDLAHAVGNVQLNLHKWNVDFAAWCTYKYLNSSPGGIGGIFVHSKHMDAPNKALTGWWSNKSDTRFEMNFDLDRELGAAAFVISNPPPLLLCVNYANLEIFHEAGGMAQITKKQFLLTGFLEYLIHQHLQKSVKIITPSTVKDRGSQLSLEFDRNLQDVHVELEAKNVVCDTRGNIMRVAPAPLYNTYVEVWKFIQVLKNVLSL